MCYPLPVDVNAAITAAHVSDKSYPALESTGYATNTYLPFYCANFNSVQGTNLT